MKKHNQSGLSLVEVLIVCGIMGVVLLAFSTAYTQIQQNQRMISQKLEINDLKGMMIKMIMEPAMCDWQLRGPGAGRTIDTTQIQAAVGVPPDFFTLPGLYFGPDINAQPLALPAQPLVGTTSQLRVQDIRVTNLVSTGVGNMYRGSMEVSFEPGSMPMSLNNARADILFSVNPADPPNARRITQCNGSPGGGGGPAAAGQMFLARHLVPVLIQGGVAPLVRRWFQRPLNQAVPIPNPIPGASLAANRITLPVGIYRVVAYAVGDSVEDHIARFFNVTDNVEVALGSLAYASHDEGAATQSTVYGVFEVTGAPKQFELQQIVFRNPTSVPSVAMGGDGGFDVDVPGQDLVNNVFAFIEITAL